MGTAKISVEEAPLSIPRHDSKDFVEDLGVIPHVLLTKNQNGYATIFDELKNIYGVIAIPVDSEEKRIKLDSTKDLRGYQLTGSSEKLVYAAAYLKEALERANEYAKRELIGNKATAVNFILPFREQILAEISRRHELIFSEEYLDANVAANKAAELLQLKQFLTILSAFNERNLDSFFGEHAQLLRNNDFFMSTLASPKIRLRTENDLDNFLLHKLNDDGCTIGSVLLLHGFIGAVDTAALLAKATTPLAIVNKKAPVVIQARNDFNNRTQKARSRVSSPTNLRNLPGKIELSEFKPRSIEQALFYLAIEEYPIVLAVGASGGGKTFTALQAGLENYRRRLTEEIVILRPQITNTGGQMPPVPGGLQEKNRMWFQALEHTLAAITDGASFEGLQSVINTGRNISITRGETLSNFTIIDEAQNIDMRGIEDIILRLQERDIEHFLNNGGNAAPPYLEQKLILTGSLSDQVDLDLGNEFPGIHYIIHMMKEFMFEHNDAYNDMDDRTSKAIRRALNGIAIVNFPPSTANARNSLAEGFSSIAKSSITNDFKLRIAETFHGKEAYRLRQKLNDWTQNAQDTVDKAHQQLLEKHEPDIRELWPHLFEEPKHTAKTHHKHGRRNGKTHHTNSQIVIPELQAREP